VRAGYGIYHEQFLVGFCRTKLIGVNPPYQENFTIPNTRLDNPAGGTLKSALGSSLDYSRNGHGLEKHPICSTGRLDVQQPAEEQYGVFGRLLSDQRAHILVGVTELNDLPPRPSFEFVPAPPGANTHPRRPVSRLVRCQPGRFTHFRNSATTAAQGNPNIVTGVPPFTDNAILDQLSSPIAVTVQSPCLQPTLQFELSQPAALSAASFLGGASQLSASYTWSKKPD